MRLQHVEHVHISDMTLMNPTAPKLMNPQSTMVRCSCYDEGRPCFLNPQLSSEQTDWTGLAAAGLNHISDKSCDPTGFSFTSCVRNLHEKGKKNPLSFYSHLVVTFWRWNLQHECKLERGAGFHRKSGEFRVQVKASTIKSLWNQGLTVILV